MKHAFLIPVVVCLLAATAFADYVGPPGWDNDPYFTHQSWHFTNPPQPPDEPPLPPDVDQNPYDVAMADRLHELGNWVDDLGGEYVNPSNPVLVRERQGGWRFESVAGDFAEIAVPNVFDPTLRKELWFQATFKYKQGAIPEVSVVVEDDSGNLFQETAFDFEVFGFDPVEGGIWARATYIFDIFPQPESEVLTFSAALGEGEFLVVDQVDIDTHCVPEPSTVVLLGSGGLLCLALCVRRRRK